MLELREDAVTTVAAGAASAVLDPGTYRLLAVGADFRVKAGPDVTNGANGLRLTAGLPEIFYVRKDSKIGVSAV